MGTMDLNKLKKDAPKRQAMRQDPGTGKRYDSHYHNKQTNVSETGTKKPVAAEEIKPYVQQSEQQPSVSSSNISKKIAETKEKISKQNTTYTEENEQSQILHEEINPLFAEEGYELQRSKPSKIIHRLFQKFRASFSKEDEDKLAHALQRNSCRLALYKAGKKDEKKEIADIVFCGEISRPWKGFSFEYQKVVNYPYKYAKTPRKEEEYPEFLQKSLWAVMRQFPEFASIEKKVISKMATAGIPPEILPGMKLVDFKRFLFDHCSIDAGGKEKNISFKRLFPQLDENGNEKRSDNGNILTTSAKRAATIEFVEKYGDQFKALMMKQPHARSDYVDALIEEMKRGNTDMTRYLSSHPEWKDQTAVNLHHIIAKKDLFLLPRMGLQLKDINQLPNLCMMDCGTVGMMSKVLSESAERSQSVKKDSWIGKIKQKLLAGSHGEMHNHDTTFENGQMVRTKFGKYVQSDENQVIARVEPAAGVVCMIGFEAIIDEDRRKFDLEHRCRPDLYPEIERNNVRQQTEYQQGVVRQ